MVAQRVDLPWHPRLPLHPRLAPLLLWPLLLPVRLQLRLLVRLLIMLNVVRLLCSCSLNSWADQPFCRWYWIQWPDDLCCALQVHVYQSVLLSMPMNFSVGSFLGYHISLHLRFPSISTALYVDSTEESSDTAARRVSPRSDDASEA